MSAEEMRGLLRRQPFQPLRLALSDGRVYVVTHPRLVIVGRTFLAVGLRSPGDDEDIYDRIIMLDLDQIVQVEPLESATPPAAH
jgi:hypothetical protein